MDRVLTLTSGLLDPIVLLAVVTFGLVLGLLVVPPSGRHV
jgi:hypothetical protein